MTRTTTTTTRGGGGGEEEEEEEEGVVTMAMTHMEGINGKYLNIFPPLVIQPRRVIVTPHPCKITTMALISGILLRPHLINGSSTS